MLNFQDLPDEVVLKILSYSETKELLICGQVSKRIRRISHDGTLWVSANLEKKIMKTELLEMILGKGCRILNLSHSTILGSLSSNIKSELRVLNLSGTVTCYDVENLKVLEELLFSCCSLQHLVMEDVLVTPKMVVSICKNGKTLQSLNLNSSNAYLKEIIKCCQELKEVDFAYVNNTKHWTYGGVSNGDLEFLVKNIPPSVEKLNLSGSRFTDDHVKILLGRCNKIKAFSLEATWISDDSLKNIRQHLFRTLEELSLGRTFRYPNIAISLTGFLALKSMRRLKILNVYYQKNRKEIQNLRRHLPHLNLSRLWGEWLSMIGGGYRTVS